MADVQFTIDDKLIEAVFEADDLAPLVEAVLNEILEAEITDHLDYPVDPGRVKCMGSEDIKPDSQPGGVSGESDKNDGEKYSPIPFSAPRQNQPGENKGGEEGDGQVGSKEAGRRRDPGRQL